MTKRIFSILILAMILITMFTPTIAFASGEGLSRDIPVIKMDGEKLDLGGFDSKDSDSVWTELFEKYRGFIVGITGVGALTMIILFIVQFLKLGASAGNPQARSQALTGVLWTGIAAAGLGSVCIITAFFYNAV